jgi:hypothetical protein
MRISHFMGISHFYENSSMLIIIFTVFVNIIIFHYNFSKKTIAFIKNNRRPKEKIDFFRKRTYLFREILIG